MKRWQWLVILLMIVAVALSLLYLWQSPRLVEFSPQDGATVQASSELHLVFSRHMQPASVQAHLTISPSQAGEFQWQGKTLIFTPTGFWPAGQVVKVRLSPGARAAGWLGFTTYREVSWSFQISQPRLVYLYPANDAANLYALSLPSAADQSITPERLTNLDLGILDFTVTADGKDIYFSAKDDQQNSAIYRLDMTAHPTPEATIILECPQALCQAVAVSPQGDYLAYERTDYQAGAELASTRVWWVALPPPAESSALAATLPPLQPALAGEAPRQTVQPDWSSTNLLSYYDLTQAAFIVLDPVRGKTWMFANQTGQPGSWNPAGNDYVAPEISISESGNPAIVAGSSSFGNSHLVRFDLTTNATQYISVAEDLEDTSPAYSPDGTYLVLARKYLDITRWTPGRQIWLMQNNGQGARPLTNDPEFTYFDFAWSPGWSGQTADEWIACVRFNQTIPTEPPELWIIDPLTGRGLKLVVGGYAPRWLP